ncbi:hypothetical protein TNCV_2723211 [Trichonephila clavipes]|nr:hypothetical protein TNCV_2723211 [Trichonephila clavipes]
MDVGREALGWPKGQESLKKKKVSRSEKKEIATSGNTFLSRKMFDCFWTCLRAELFAFCFVTTGGLSIYFSASSRENVHRLKEA